MRRFWRQMVRVFITGAGASKDAGYPLGSELLSEIDSYVRSSGRCLDRFDYSKDWPEICRWLETNENLLLQEAYRTRNLESLFTALDFVEQLRQDPLDAVARLVVRHDTNAAKQAEGEYKRINQLTDRHYGARRILLWALEQFLEFKHQSDRRVWQSNEWDYLRSFGRMLNPGDVVITFNYDSTLERVLHEQGKWFPSDGYDFPIVFQKSRNDVARVPFPRSPIKILHLHGAIGWYKKPPVSDLSLPIETEIGLDPMFLDNLGVSAVDASLPVRPADERHVFIHPSFLKNYEYDGGQNTAFIHVWKRAAEYLRTASQIFIAGYSLPEADSAALTLLITTCSGKDVRIINTDGAANYRLNLLLGQPLTKGWKMSFKQWLADQA